MAAAFWAATPTTGQPTSAAIPRTAAGRPDLNGIWQALNTANYDLEAHGPRAAMAMRPGPVVPVPAKEVVALGAVGAVPGGLSVVAGGTIPYLPDALARKRENQEHWLARDPEIKCYLPGVPRATYVPFPFQILPEREGVLHRLRVRRRRAQHLLERSWAAAGGHVDGAIGRQVGG